MSLRAIALAAALAVSAGMAASAEATLLLRYTFDEGSGAALDGGAGAPANGTFSGTSTRVTSTPGGAPGYAMSTNGGAITNYVTGGDSDKLDGLAKFTVSGWINLLAGPTQLDRFVSDHSASPSNAGWDLLVDGNSGSTYRLHLSVNGSSYQATSASAAITYSPGWMFFAVSYDSALTSGAINYYLGSETGAVALSASGVRQNAVPGLNTTDFRVGGTPRSGSDRTPNAYFDDIRVYDEVLTQASLDSIRLSNVPEPATVTLLGLGLAGLVLRRHKA